ncbi:MAG: hypothetical protein ACO1OB_23195 [Archangium sp.]
MRVRFIEGAVLVAVVAALAAHIAHYFPFLSDDALISLRYADRFLEGKGLTWTDGERVEGYTDFAWVLLTALLGALKVDLVVAARALGVVGAASCVIFPALTLGERPTVSIPRTLSGSLAMALSAPVAVWAIGALEHGFQAGVIVVTAFLLMRRAYVAQHSRREQVVLGVCLVLLAWLRADGAVCIGGLLIGNALRGLLARRGFKVVLIENVVLGLAPLFALVAQLVFRRVYYGAWVPNTALVKAGASVARLQLGLTHLSEWAKWGWPVLVLTALAIVVLVRARRFSWLSPVVMSLLWWGYIAVMGGDIFPAWRQVLLGIAPLGLVIAEGAELWWSQTTTQPPRVVAVLAATALFVFYGRQQEVDPTNRRAISERWEFEGVSLGPVLRTAWGEKAPLIAVDAAGTLPYYSKLPSLDLLGLNDRFIASHPPPVVGLLSTGHELGDGPYTWSRKPDILAFCGGMGGRNACFLGGKQMLALPAFNRFYQLVRYHTPGPPDLRGELWIRREESVLGVERSADRIRVPSWLLTQSGGVTELNEGRFRAVVSSFDPARIDALEVPKGRWRVTIEASAQVVAGVLCGATNASRKSATSIVFDTTDVGALTLLIGTRDRQPAFVDSVVLERTNDEATVQCPKRPLVLDAAALTTVVEEGSFFHQPGGAVLQRGEPVVITLPAKHGTRFEASLDANDAYLLTAFRGDAVLAESKLPIIPNVAGLYRRVFDVPADADRLQLIPVDGDPLSGIGHLAEVP